MFFSRISCLALALAAGLAAPASAATYNVSFALDGGGNVGSGTFTLPKAPPTTFSTFSFRLTLNGVNGSTSPVELLFTPEGDPFAMLGFGAFNPSFGEALIGSVVSPSVDPSVFLGFGNTGTWGVREFFDECLVPDDDAFVEERDEGELTSSDTSEEGPAVCGRSWTGTYTFTSGDPVDPGDPAVIPLPATAALLPLGLAALGALRRRKSKG